MIELKLTGKCNGCPYLEIQQNDLYPYDGQKITHITCIHEDFCNHLEERLETIRRFNER